MNKEIKMIDLLSMIANNEEIPRKIKYDGIVYVLDDEESKYKSLLTNEPMRLYNFSTLNLNDIVEIIEEDNNKIEYLEDFDFDYKLDTNEKCEILREWYQNLKRKQDEILDKLNNME